jgi:transcriptional regulator with XRE-family HTH domain
VAKRELKYCRYGKTGAFMRSQRIALGLSQRQVCRSLKIKTSQCVSNLERGIALPPLPTLRLIIAKYGVPFSKIVDLILEDEKKRLKMQLC